MRKAVEYSTATMVLLVLLRIAIGWHFFFEGSEKLRSDNWSSEGYLRESTGPLAPLFRKIAGDGLADRLTPRPLPTNREVTGGELAEYMPPALEKDWQAWYDAFLRHYDLPRESSEQIKKDLDGVREEVRDLVSQWEKIDDARAAATDEVRKADEELAKIEANVKRLEADLKAGEAELEELRAKIDETKDEREKKVLSANKDELEKRHDDVKSRLASEKGKKKPAEDKRKEVGEKLKKVREPQEKLEGEIEKLEDRQRKLVQRQLTDVRFKRRKEQTVRWLTSQKVKAETRSPYGPPVTRERTIAERIDDYRKLLEQAQQLEDRELAHAEDSLTKNKVNADIRTAKADANRIRGELRGELSKQTSEMHESVRDVLKVEPGETVPMPETVKPPLLKRNFLGWVDTIIPLALVVIGSCLLLGFLTRTNCVLGAILLLSFYLAMPALPWTPDNPRAEGHYLYVNKNIIEMLALLVLATTRVGRWGGLDALVAAVFNKKK